MRASSRLAQLLGAAPGVATGFHPVKVKVLREAGSSTLDVGVEVGIGIAEQRRHAGIGLPCGCGAPDPQGQTPGQGSSQDRRLAPWPMA